MSEDSISHEMLYPYSIWTVWHALTNAEALAQWLMPNDFVPQVGHRFTFHPRPQHGWSGQIACQVVELCAPYRISYTWQGDDNMPTTLVTFTLEALGSQTRLHLEHSGFARGGAKARNIRDLLDSGWGSKLQRGQLLTLLTQLEECT